MPSHSSSSSTTMTDKDNITGRSDKAEGEFSALAASFMRSHPFLVLTIITYVALAVPLLVIGSTVILLFLSCIAVGFGGISLLVLPALVVAVLVAQVLIFLAFGAVRMVGIARESVGNSRICNRSRVPDDVRRWKRVTQLLKDTGPKGDNPEEAAKLAFEYFTQKVHPHVKSAERESVTIDVAIDALNAIAVELPTGPAEGNTPNKVSTCIPPTVPKQDTQA